MSPTDPLSGDVAYDDELLDTIHGADIPAYLASMARLKQLPAHTVHAGHGPSFTGARLSAIADAYIAQRTTPGTPQE
jgi:glyoxylase-like metal-dependent hydrolase (beta-lactamase superfamily II)